MMRIASLTSFSYQESSMSPVAGLVVTGKLHPTPRNSRWRRSSTSAADQHGRGTDRYRVGSASFDDHVALSRGRQSTDENGRAPFGDHSTDVRLHSVDERTDVGVAERTPRRHSPDED